MANINVKDFVNVNRVCVSFDEMCKMLKSMGYDITPGYAKSKFKALHKYFSKTSQRFPWRKKLKYYDGWNEDHRGRKSMTDSDINELFENYTEPTIADSAMESNLIESKANAFIPA